MYEKNLRIALQKSYSASDKSLVGVKRGLFGDRPTAFNAIDENVSMICRFTSTI